MGCALPVPKGLRSSDECIEQLVEQTKSRPMQTHLETLDGQKILLKEFFQRCRMNSPPCSLPNKFYHWKNEVRQITSETPHGPVLHKIRIYHNYLSICRPDLANPRKIHGDIAEFYNQYGEFMGLAIYVTDGLYLSLPYSRYKGTRHRPGNLMKKTAQHPN